MPRILLLTNRVPYPLHDGGALAMDAMIRGYHDAGQQVYVLAMNTTRHEVSKDLLARLYKDIAGFETVEVNNIVSKSGVLKNLFFSREPEHVARFRSEAFAAQLRAMLHEIQPDVVQLESPFLASYIPLVRQESKALLVYRMHNVEGQIWSRLAKAAFGSKRTYLSILAKRIARYEQELWRTVDLLLPITDADADIVKAAGIVTPQVVTPFGIHPPEALPGLPSGPFKVYHIGAMDWLPNVEAVGWFLKKVWPKLHENAPEISFHFAGRAMPPEFFENLPASVFCEGEVSDAASFIADKHILVVPLFSGSGIRVKILEAMARGRLVVSTDIGMQGIEAKSDNHYLRANTAAEFIHLIGWASAHPEKAASIARTGQEHVRAHYDGKVIIARVVRKLEVLLG